MLEHPVEHRVLRFARSQHNALFTAQQMQRWRTIVLLQILNRVAP